MQTMPVTHSDCSTHFSSAQLICPEILSARQLEHSRQCTFLIAFTAMSLLAVPVLLLLQKHHSVHSSREVGVLIE